MPPDEDVLDDCFPGARVQARLVVESDLAKLRNEHDLAILRERDLATLEVRKEERDLATPPL